jgi:hypothetical protein
MHRKQIQVTTLATLFFLAAPLPSLAWGGGIPGALVETSLRRIDEQISGTILGAIKTAAVSSIANQVNRLINGNAGQIISSYDDYLRRGPELETRTHIYNFLARTYRGLGSTSNYSGQGGSNVGGNYASRIEQGVREGVVDRKTYRYTLNEYCRDPERSLHEGDLRCLDAWRSNPANNPYGARLLAEEEYRRVYEEIRYQRQVQANSSGILGTVDPKTGKISAPAGTVEAVYNDSVTLVNKIITNAKNPAELASGVALALANRAINSIASKAAGAVESLVDKTVGKAVTEINRLAGDASNILRTADGYILTADGYVTEAGYQREQISKARQGINQSTPAPPGAVDNCTPGSPGCVY